MRRPTQGQVIKKRVWRFVEALLNHAEDSPDFKVHWEDEDTNRPKLVVTTKRRFLEEVAELKQSQVYEVINSLKNIELLEDRRVKQKRGSDQWCFALKLWSRDVQRNREQFERVWEANRPEKSKALEANYQKSDQFDWQNICKTMLEKQKEMTTNRLMNQSEMVFDLNQIHVPLALVERKKSDKRHGDDSPENSHSYKPEYEETQKLEYEEFLAVLKTATNKKIAIIGEPGAGKTTLLQRIAFWVLENTDDLAIWIPLGNLPTTAPNFKDYLLNNWLQNAIQSLTPEIKADFEKQLTAGRVWLLLDGVDEMATSGNALSFINNWLPAWSQNLHFVLTCRLNVWEANPNYLSDFQTYRTLEFNQEQVKDFINNCFQNRGNSPVVTPKLGIELQQALNQPGKERIKDLVRNPLRLMLLCSTWQGLEGKLPDTKAELYQHFVDEVYRWKKEELRITPQRRKELNAKLKELALAAIDKEENRFSLREKFVEIMLGECDDELFQFALRVGWLNLVGVDGKNKPVYAFFHPTFQEYFAALAIENWRYFLNHVPDNPAQGIYRIFEPQWKEVILLWLGREDVAREEKEEFIKALVEFDYGCEGFYWYRAYFLASVCISEFSNYEYAEQIVNILVGLGFGYCTDRKYAGKFIEPIAEGAKVVLPETDRTIAMAVLAQLIQNSKQEFVLIQLAEKLGEIDKDNPTAITALVELIHNSQYELNRSQAVYILGKITQKDSTAISTLIELMHDSQDEFSNTHIADSLAEIAKNNPSVIVFLVKLIHNSQDEFVRKLVAISLGRIEKDEPMAIDALVDLIYNSKHIYTSRQATGSLQKIAKDNSKAIATFVDLIHNCQDEFTCRLAAAGLGRVRQHSSKEIAIATLVELSHTSEHESLRGQAAFSLRRIGKDNSIVIAALGKLIDNSHDESTLIQAATSLGEIDKYNQTAITTLVKIIQKPQNEHHCRQAAESLGKIKKDHPVAIDALVELMLESKDEDNRWRTVSILGEIGKNNQIVIDALVKLIQKSQNEFIHWQAADSLGKIDKDNPMAITTLVKLIQNSQDETTRKLAVGSLKKLLTETKKMTEVVIFLKDYLSYETYENNFKQFSDCYNLIWHCAQNMNYPDFHKAWHSTP